jgi:hypothetical protein
MRAPGPSFESELAAALRDKSTPKERSVGRGRTVIAAGPATDKRHLARWLSDERSEVIWVNIHRRAPDLSPRDFIAAVLAARRSATASVNRLLGTCDLPGFRQEWSTLLAAIKKQVRQELLTATPNGSPVQLAIALESAARDARMLHSLYLDRGNQVAVTRQGSNLDRTRKAFMQIMSEYFKKYCGAQLRAETAALTEIAFPGKEIDLDNVRDALRLRGRGRPAK